MAAIPGRDAAGTQRETGPDTEGCAVRHVTEADRARSVLSVLMVLTGLAADSALAGGTYPRALASVAVEASSSIRGYLDEK